MILLSKKASDKFSFLYLTSRHSRPKFVSLMATNWIIKWILFLLLGLNSLSANCLYGQQVWPGDANNNGIVNGVDALFIGLGFGSTGPGREDEETDWTGQNPPTPWPETFPNGLNYYFADCNGDGTIDGDDVMEAVLENYLSEKPDQEDIFPDGYTNASPGGSAAELRLEPTTTAINVEDPLEVEIFLGNENTPIENFYGISFQLSYSTKQGSNFEDPVFAFENNGWFDPSNNNSILFFASNEEGRSDLTICRTDQQTIPMGSGKLGEFSIIMEDIIVGLEQDTFVIKVDSVLLFTDQATAIPIKVDSTSVLVFEEGANETTENNRAKNQWRVWPNPAEDYIQIDGDMSAIQDIALFDTRGQRIGLYYDQHVVNRGRTYRWDKDLPSGLYWLRLNSHFGISTKKIIILNNN